MPPPRYGGPKLPSNLLSQVGDARANNHGARRARNAPPSRKESRKLERQQKKQQKTQSRPPQGKFVPSTLGFVKTEESGSEDESDASPPPPRPVTAPKKSNGTAVDADKAQPKSILKHREQKSTQPEKGLNSATTVEKRLVTSDSKPSRKVQAKLDEDDAEIAALEKRLGIKKKGKLNKSFQDDGLDLLLDELDETMGFDEPKKGKRKNDEDSAWLEMKRRKVGNLAEEEIASGSEDEDEDEEFSDEDVSDEIEGEMDMADSDQELEEDASRAEIQLEDDEPDWDDEEDEVVSDGDDDDDNDNQVDVKQPPTRSRENPYVAPATTTPTSQKYIPPSLRKSADSDTEALSRLRRQTQGLLNRLSEANILTILSDIEKLYQSNPRQHVTSTLRDLLIDLIRDRATLNDTFIILHAAFIAGVYRTIGIDFGAQLVQRLVEQFDHYYNIQSAPDSADPTTTTTNKEPLNLISLLSHLYNFHVVASPLIFDYARHFLSKLTELHTELLLRLVRSSGPALRHDDPAALKDIVLLLQQAVAAAPETPSVRTRFMIDTITDLKNNKLKPGAGAASDMGAEHAAKLRKTLGALGARGTARASEPLRVSLADLRDTDKRGKWWLVGASWRGHDDTTTTVPPTTSQPATTSTIDTTHDTDILTSTPDLASLATSARMTTPARRAIFISLLSAADAADAITRIRRLRLSQPQRPDIARVLLHCAGAEATYNPYYALVARRVCAEDPRRMGMAVQGAFGEFFRKIDVAAEDDDVRDGGEEMGLSVVVNVARFCAELLAAGTVWIGLLKNLNLPYLSPKLKVFVEVLLVNLLTEHAKPTAASPTPLVSVFERAVERPELAQGLQWFLKKVVAKTDLVPRGGKRYERLKRRCGEVVEMIAARLVGREAVSGGSDEEEDGDGEGFE